MKLRVTKIPWYLSWKGLLGQKSRPVLLKTRFGIHTFGMRYPIDVVILDRLFTIKKLKKNLFPNRFFFWTPVYDTILELPRGMIKKLHLHEGEKIYISLRKRS